MVKLFVESHGVRSLAVQKEYYKKNHLWVFLKHYVASDPM